MPILHYLSSVASSPLISRHVLVEEGSFSSCSDGITLFYPWLHIPVEPLKSYNLEALPDSPLLCLFFSFRFPSSCSPAAHGGILVFVFPRKHVSVWIIFLVPCAFFSCLFSWFRHRSHSFKTLPLSLLGFCKSGRTYMVWLDGQRRKDTRLTQEQTQRTKQVKDDGNIERRERATKLHFLQRKKGFGMDVRVFVLCVLVGVSEWWYNKQTWRKLGQAESVSSPAISSKWWETTKERASNKVMQKMEMGLQ